MCQRWCFPADPPLYPSAEPPKHCQRELRFDTNGLTLQPAPAPMVGSRNPEGHLIWRGGTALCVKTWCLLLQPAPATRVGHKNTEGQLIWRCGTALCVKIRCFPADSYLDPHAEPPKQSQRELRFDTNGMPLQAAPTTRVGSRNLYGQLIWSGDTALCVKTWCFPAYSNLDPPAEPPKHSQRELRFGTNDPSLQPAPDTRVLYRRFPSRPSRISTKEQPERAPI